MALLALASFSGLACAGARGKTPIEGEANRPSTVVDEARALFTEQGVSGATVVLVPPAGAPEAPPERIVVESGDRVAERTLPASTFKIANLLIGLETGAITADTLFKWDGQPRALRVWERDLTLPEAFRASCVPCFQEIARGVGLERMTEWLRRIGYGNAEVGAHVDRFWLEGPLEISVDEEAAFVRRLYLGQLPFAPAHVEALKQAMLVEEAPGYRLFAKTGWAIRREPHVGWYVGWVETAQGPRFFATRVRLPGDRAEALLGLRKDLTLGVLRKLGAIP